MDCETCKEKRRVIAQTPKDVPYIVHEGAVARLERVIKRLWVLVLALIILLCASNAAWIWCESQFEEVKTVETYEANADNGGNAIANGSGEVTFNGNG